MELLSQLMGWGGAPAASSPPTSVSYVYVIFLWHKTPPHNTAICSYAHSSVSYCLLLIVCLRLVRLCLVCLRILVPRSWDLQPSPTRPGRKRTLLHTRTSSVCCAIQKKDIQLLCGARIRRLCLFVYSRTTSVQTRREDLDLRYALFTFPFKSDPADVFVFCSFTSLCWFHITFLASCA